MSETSIGDKKDKTDVQTRCILSGGVYLLHRSNHFPPFPVPNVFFEGYVLCSLSSNIRSLIEQVYQCTRAAFWRAGVQEAFVSLRQTQQRGAGEIDLLGGKKNEPFLFVGGIIGPDLDSGWF